MTEEERALLQAYVDEAYRRFVTVVSTGRDMPEEEVRGEWHDLFRHTGSSAWIGG